MNPPDGITAALKRSWTPKTLARIREQALQVTEARRKEATYQFMQIDKQMQEKRRRQLTAASNANRSSSGDTGKKSRKQSSGKNSSQRGRSSTANSGARASNTGAASARRGLHAPHVGVPEEADIWSRPLSGDRFMPLAPFFVVDAGTATVAEAAEAKESTGGCPTYADATYVTAGDLLAAVVDQLQVQESSDDPWGL